MKTLDKTLIGLMFPFAGAANGMVGKLIYLHSSGESLPSSAQGLDLGQWTVDTNIFLTKKSK